MAPEDNPADDEWNPSEEEWDDFLEAYDSEADPPESSEVSEMNK